MRPTGVVLIAFYHFLSALFLVLLAMSLVVGGSILGAMFGGGHERVLGGVGLGLLVGVVGATFFLFYAAIAVIAGYGIWTLREWGRILSIVLAILSLIFSLPGLLMLGMHFGFFFGSYRLLRVAISVLIFWYLMQPQIRSLFRRATPAAPVI